MVVAALVGIGAAVVARRDRPLDDLHAAERALLADDPTTARARLERYLARRPDDGRALFLAARAARRDNAHADAERLLTAAERATGATDATRLEWVLLGLQQGEFAEEKQLRALVARNHPDAPAILEAFAKGLVAADRRKEAIEAYSMLLAGKPDHVPGLIGRGGELGLMSLDRVDLAPVAERDLRRAIGLAPGSATAHAGLGRELSRTGHTREAIAHFERSLEIRPNHAATLVGLARALADHADIRAAERRLDELLALQPDHADALVERGRLALRRGRPDEAESLLAKAVRAAPWHRDGHALRLMALKELKRTADEAACAARLAELRAEDGLIGRLKMRARDAPSDTAVRWELWLLWSLKNGEPEKGIAWLAEILHVAPRHARARAALAEYFERAGQPRRAAGYRKP
jgi:tetratricopeptide (TPR) repeat protein